MSPAEVLEKAAAIVETRWCQWTIGSQGGPRCARGAIDEAVFCDPVVPGRMAVFNQAIEALSQAIAPDAASPADILFPYESAFNRVTLYNDVPGRKAEHVAAKMREAAELARKGGDQ